MSFEMYILSFSNYIILPVFIQLLETFLEITIHDLLQHNL